MISNRDIGFVEVGQDAAIKVDAFQFHAIRLLQGKVPLRLPGRHLARQAAGQTDRQAAGRRKQSSSEPKGQDLSYAARVSLDRTGCRSKASRSNLSPGMAVTVEIKTGSRSIISYLLSPLAALQAGEPAREMIVSRVTRISLAKHAEAVDRLRRVDVFEQVMPEQYDFAFGQQGSKRLGDDDRPVELAAKLFPAAPQWLTAGPITVKSSRALAPMCRT